MQCLWIVEPVLVCLALAMTEQLQLFSGSHAIPLLLTICPRYFMDFRNKTHIIAFNFRLAAFSLCMTHLKLPRVSLKVLPKMIISSRYTKHLSHCRPLKTVSMSRWNVAGAPESPNGITRNWNRPLWVMNAALCLSSSFIFTCQYPEARSKVQTTQRHLVCSTSRQ